MTMNEFLSIALAFAAGLVLGGIFFGGLWLTIRKGISGIRPALWFFGSLMLRMSLALAGFYFVGRGNWKRMLLSLLGFVMARLVLNRLIRQSPDSRTHPAKEASHAP